MSEAVEAGRGEKLGAVGSPMRKGLSWVTAPVVIFAGMAVLFGLALISGDPSKLPSALIGKPVPETEFPTLDGLVESGRPVPGFRSADLAQGKVSIVNFWASWCSECIDEHPLLAVLKERGGVDIYGVNYKDQTEDARRYLGRYGNPYAAVGVDGTGRNAIEWGVYGMPETFVVDGKGRVAFKFVGPITKQTFETKLLPAIEKARAPPSPAAAN